MSLIEKHLELELHEYIVPNVTDNNESQIACAADTETDGLWSEKESLALLAAYENHVDDFRKAKKRKLVWQMISEELATLGVKRSATRCERKWLNMIRVYKSKKDGKTKTSRSSSAPYKYYDRLDQILGDRPSNMVNNNVINVGFDVEPETEEENSEETINHREETINHIKRKCEEDNESDERILQKKMKHKQNITINKFEYLELKRKAKQEEREKREERHRELVALEKERLALERRKIDVLEKYLEYKEKSLNR